MNDNSITIKPYRLYRCKQDNTNLTRDKVTKDANGVYHCGLCGGAVEDISTTSTGQNILYVVFGVRFSSEV